VDAAAEREAHAPLALRRLAAGHPLPRQARVQLPGPPRGEPRAARDGGALRQVRAPHGNEQKALKPQMNTDEHRWLSRSVSGEKVVGVDNRDDAKLARLICVHPRSSVVAST